MNVRRFKPADHPHWFRMRRSLWPDCADDMHEYEMNAIARGEGEGTVFIAADDNDRPVGFAEVSIRARVDGTMSERVGYLEGWFIEESHRGKGYGAALIRMAEEWTRGHGLTELASDAEIGNEGSIRAHHALGFRETFRVVQFVKTLGPKD